MIELIFAILIIGILASVAIPKLISTRDDARAAKEITNLRTAKNEIISRLLLDHNVTSNDYAPLDCFTVNIDTTNRVLSFSNSSNNEDYCVKARNDANSSGLSSSYNY